VSTEKDTGKVLACIKKRKVADMNVANGKEQLDFRVSVSTEENCQCEPCAFLPGRWNGRRDELIW
jgi:hypothetical protein